MLIKEGLINSQRGVGTKVLSPSLWGSSTDQAVKNDLDKLQIDKSQQKNLTCSILDFEVGFPNKKVQEQLLIPKEQPIYCIKRMFYLKKEPYVLEELFIPVALVPGLSKEIVSKSFYSHITSKLKMKLGGTFRNIYAESANKEVINYLNCARSVPILVVEQVAYLKDGNPIEFSICRSIRNRRSVTAVNVQTA